MKKKIALIGGLGFIGTNLCKQLESKYDITIIDNFSCRGNLKYLKNIKKIKCDILNKQKLLKVTKNFNIIINLAAQTGVLESKFNPSKSIYNNILGFYNVLEVSKINKIKKIINASTAGAIYGNSSKKKSDENSKSMPKSYYALTKKFNEDQSKIFNENKNLQILNLRFSNIYGPFSEHKKSLINSSIKNSILKNIKTTIFGNGKQTRDFIYVKDVAKIILLFLNSNKNIDGIFNVASGKSFSVNKILSLIKIIDKEFSYKRGKSNPVEIKEVKISNVKLVKFLKLRNFFTSLEMGISETYKWYKSKYQKKC